MGGGIVSSIIIVILATTISANKKVSTNDPAFGVPGYDYTTMFSILDSNQDGFISIEEFENGGLMPDEMDDGFRKMFDECDQNKNYKLELKEFIVFVERLKK